jgi:hypothetical protein
MSYPATYDVETPDEIDNWRAIGHFFMAIPHFVVMWVLSFVGSIVAVISWFAILFTGQLPVGLANLQAMVLRYGARTWTFAAFLHEEYPPFDFTTTSQEPGGTPVSVSFTPELEDRNRLTVGLRFLWIIPAAIFMVIIVWVAQILTFIAFFVVLFTGRWPSGLRDFVVKALRLWVRVEAYGFLLTDQYPPFALDGADPVTPPPAQ